jgi:hypothetical protein
LNRDARRAIFIYFTRQHFKHSKKDNFELESTVGLKPKGLSAEELQRFYGPGVLKTIVAADLFPENSLIRHGFDEVCRQVLEQRGSEYIHRHRIAEVYLRQKGSQPEAAGVVIESVETGERRCAPVDFLGLSLGPTATFHFAGSGKVRDWIEDKLKVGLPVPHQTIATGISAQVLFRITDPTKAIDIPLTGMKQTHFVEIGRTATHVLMKLTCGGVIGLPVYSRSYGISALASLLRTITPDMGLQFVDVVCAWPCTRAVNVSNNGQIARLADNFVVRFGEGGTGMSKMATNAQTMLDLMGLHWPLPDELRMQPDLYQHTILDRRGLVMKRLLRKKKGRVEKSEVDQRHPKRNLENRECAKNCNQAMNF